MGNKSGYSLSRPRLSRKKGYVQRRRLLRMMQAEKAKHSKTTEDANDKCNHFDQFVESPSDKIDTEDTKIDISIKQFLDSTSNTMSASTDNIPEPQLFTHSIINTHPVDKMLKMECIEEPLSETQLSSTMKLEDMTDYDRVAATLEQLVEDYGGKLVRQTGVISYEYTLPANQTATPTIVPDNPQISNVTRQKENSAPIKLESDNISESQENVQLESEPCAGANLEPVTQTQGTTTTTTSSVASTNTQTQQKENYVYNKSGRKIGRVIYVRRSDTRQVPALVACERSNPGPAIQTPMEHTSIGGIFNIAGNKNTTCEQIDEAKKNQSSDGESTFNRMEDDLFARSFPSLMVVVRPSIRDKYIRSQVAHTERRALDDKVKNMLGFSAAKFTEWLFEQGLVKSRQYCSHHSTKSEKVNLKLEMYSVRGTFPYSGGYVWSSNCCPDRYVSVFSGSVFQEAPYMPTVLLKLIYHWACQTDVQNVISWVNVSNIYLQNFYANLRSICTAAVWDKSRKMGGKNSEIQVGVIKLRTMLTMPSGHTRQVQIEVLAVLDPVTSDIRLRACDPMQGGDRLVRRRFHNILRPLKEWVHTDSKIMTDFTVDKRALNDLGYNHVVQSAFAGQNSKNMNNFHMEFLRKSVWAMFQKTMLSLLGRHMIQQFLDELIWRETYGGTSKRAFDNIIRHIAEQTKFDLNNNLINRLAKIASNPFHDWSYTMTHSAGDMLASSKADHH